MNAKRCWIFAPVIGAALLLLAASASLAQDEPALTTMAQLGKSIFFDQDLSVARNQSCATCHGPEVGWTGPDEGTNASGSIYEGSLPGRFGNRKPPSSAYATNSPILHFVIDNIDNEEAIFIGGNFWDGRATGERLGNPAADQAQGPFLNPMEQALTDAACVVYRVCNPVHPADYPVTFEDVWGEGACAIAWPADVETTCAHEGGTVALSPADRAKADTAYDSIGLTIAAYEASPEVSAFTSKYDYYLKGMATLTQQEKQGLNLFKSKGKCSGCHVLDPGPNGEPPLFTDFTYDNLGLPRNPMNPVYAKVSPDWVDTGLGGFLGSRPDYQQFAAENLGKHKVPTLRNVDLRPAPLFVKAYGHNGYFKTLQGIVHFYSTRDALPRCANPFTAEDAALLQGCWPEPEIGSNVNTKELGKLNLTAGQEAAIVAFLKTLSDGYVPGALQGAGADEGEAQTGRLFFPAVGNESR